MTGPPPKPRKVPPPGKVWRRCRDCQTWYLLPVSLEHRSSKWANLCPGCLQYER